jgi:DNA polymerase I-like protein with 3'-5' exonuclease and polymerase domains
MYLNKEAYRLMHEGTLAFADMEQNGIRIDVPYYKKQKKNLSQQIMMLGLELDRTDELKLWKKTYGKDFKITSNDQLKKILFGKMGIEPPILTKKGNASVNEETLHLINSPITVPLIQLRQMMKLKNTYIKNILKNTFDGYLHPSFNLNTVTTFRSSSSGPNFQNMPIRNPVMGKIIRTGFIPREGGMIGGLDYSGIELSMAGCNSRDQVLINNFTTIHKTQAARCYALKEDQVTKDVRYVGKNNFVFPELYGSWYKQCAMNMMTSITSMKLETVDGLGLKKHLKSVGLGNINKFIHHIQKVEDEFWQTYHVHKRWQKKWEADYIKKGYIELVTGFKCGGIISINQLLNYSNQGPAFHCLLWSIIRMNKWLKKYKMKSKVIGQIHDDMVMDINIKESQDVLAKAKKIMCEEIKEAWSWIITPLEVEAEFSPTNWYLKKELKI